MIILKAYMTGNVFWVTYNGYVLHYLLSLEILNQYDMLPGNTDPSSPQILTPEAKRALKMLMQSIEQVHLQRVDYDKPIQLLVLTSYFAPAGVFWQSGPIMWVHMPASLSHIIMPYYDLVVSCSGKLGG